MEAENLYLTLSTMYVKPLWKKVELVIKSLIHSQ